MRVVKDFFIFFRKNSHFLHLVLDQPLDFVLQRLLGILVEVKFDDISGLADAHLRGGTILLLFFGNGLVFGHSESSCVELKGTLGRMADISGYLKVCQACQAGLT